VTRRESSIHPPHKTASAHLLIHKCSRTSEHGERSFFHSLKVVELLSAGVFHRGVSGARDGLSQQVDFELASGCVPALPNGKYYQAA
jgi:hypothetical protein